MMSKIELKYYNQEEVWDKYHDNISEINRGKEIVDLIPKNVTSVIDIGCGNGIVTNMINKSFVVGLDFAKIPLVQVNKNKILAAIDLLPVKSKKFDLILLCEVLEHLDDGAYNKTIREIKRLSSPYLIISVPFEENVDLSRCKCDSCGNYFNINHHYRTFDIDTVKGEFPEYVVEKIKYTSCRISSNEKLIKLKHKFGVYLYSDVAVCNKCGGHPMKPNRILRYVFGVLSATDNIKNKYLKIKKPYHVIMLLRK